MPPKEKKEKEKEKPAKISDKEAEKMILSYLEKQNRPYNSQMVSDNLHGAVGNTQAKKVLAAMGDANKIASKDFGKSKVYWRLQEDNAIDKRGLEELDKKVSELEAEKAPISEECKKLSAELAELNAQPSDKEADAQIAKLEKENEELSAKLKGIAGNSVVLTPAQKKKITKDYEDAKGAWRKRKRMVRDICDTLSESTNKRYKEWKEDLGFEDDEDVGVNIDKDETTKIKKGEI
eukprot:TRINITY_DN1239_c0_g1_i1.p1 TRINITY_DN1239_c0_g1~~TRINITY_DN1239_c0_g1_i1.p1  ORF type:complete len:235 (+),score=81.41 TRINITY_DN1239_c0_g1_i1:105-809(+)